ncbi:MAG: response regulator [Mongoliitalea sp.]
MSVSVLVADDHRLFTVGIRRMLDLMPEYRLIGEVQNGYEVITFLEKNPTVDILVLDLQMPLMDGMQVLAYLTRRYSSLKKLILSSNHTKSSIEACKNLGATGFLGKDSCFESFREALVRISKGEEYFQAVSSGQNSFNGHWSCLYQKLREAYHLSERETEIIQMILNQCESKEIADRLHLSPLTVKTHRKNIFKKLKVHNVSGLLGLIRQNPGL